MRVPEKSDLMLDETQCRAYNKYASDPIKLKEYVQIYENLVGISEGSVIDLGSGCCNFVIALAIHYPKLNFVCYENSEAMLKIAIENIERSNLSSRIRLVRDDLLNARGQYDVVLANRLLHHIEDTEKFWRLINSLSEKILIVDINRPPLTVVEHIRDVDVYQEPVYKEDLLSSMLAAYSLEEVKQQVKEYNYTVEADKYFRLFVYHTR